MGVDVSVPDTMRAVVLGLDGVPWDLLEGWISDGELPAFGRLLRTGVAGPLASTVPPSTPLAWPSIATGTWPDRHGIYAFQRLRSDYTHRMYTSRDVDPPALWDCLTPAVVGNVPMTYPAGEIDGTMVTGFLTDGFEAGFTHPPEFADELLSAIPDYRIGLDWSEYRSRPEAFLPEVDELLDLRRSLLEHLMAQDDWQLFFFVFTAPDRLQHLVWKEEPLLTHYKRLDDVLADVMAYTRRRGATLFVVSDHGFGPVDGTVNLNTLLAREGYLTPQTTGGIGGTLERVGLHRERVRQALRAVGLDERTIVNRLPERFVEVIASTLPGEHGLFDVDFSATTAFAHGVGSVYVNDTDRFDEGTVAPPDVGRVKSDLADLFGELSHPETGTPVLSVHDGDALYGRDPMAPELVVEGNRYVPRTALADDVFSDADGLAADHRPEGVFFAWGPHVREGGRTSATVVDVAPTVCHAVGRPVPAGADGRVLHDVFAPESPPATRAVETREYAGSDAGDGSGGDGSGGDGSGGDRDGDVSEDEHPGDSIPGGDVEERLRGLGYME